MAFSQQPTHCIHRHCLLRSINTCSPPVIYPLYNCILFVLFFYLTPFILHFRLIPLQRTSKNYDHHYYSDSIQQQSYSS